MNRCPTCGSTYSDDAKFCTRDGTQLIAVDKGAATRAAPSLVGTTLDGRFLIEKKVGEGGMSFVYLATDAGGGGRYAVKVLSASLSHDANAMARLRREAEFGMRLEHPNVCHIIHLGETDDGLVYVVMPFVDGEVLADRTNRLGHLPLAEAVGLVRDIAAGLGAAHALQIVHRDLKPENVIVRTLPTGELQAVVMDFGLAKERMAGVELQKLTATGIILGTPEFMSPEQLRGRPLDARSDVYALGLVTYEMLTGALPFEGRTQQEMMIARLRDEPIPLRKIRPALTLPESVERVLQRALQRNPDDRFASAVEFADAFAAAASANGSSPADGLLGKLFGR
ncbi:MAG TPA: serine/threonine-protein kinase [Gemmatimonadaceae bacterium]|nr:serine/threonine-protein kinase [Gemmatimonadaceae bacterium]